MRTLHLLPLLLAAGALACGEGEVALPEKSFEDPRPIIYSEQPSVPEEKSPTTPERPQAEAEADPLGSPFGLEGDGLPASGAGATPAVDAGPDPVD